MEEQCFDMEFCSDYIRPKGWHGHSRRGPQLPLCKLGEPGAEAMQYVIARHLRHVRVQNRPERGYYPFLQRAKDWPCPRCGRVLVGFLERCCIAGILCGWSADDVVLLGGASLPNVVASLMQLRGTWPMIECKCGAKVALGVPSVKQTVTWFARERGLSENEIAFHLRIRRQAVNQRLRRLQAQYPKLDGFAGRRVKTKARYIEGLVWQLSQVQGYSLTDVAAETNLKPRSVAWVLNQDKLDIIEILLGLKVFDFPRRVKKNVALQ